MVTWTLTCGKVTCILAPPVGTMQPQLASNIFSHNFLVKWFNLWTHFIYLFFKMEKILTWHEQGFHPCWLMRAFTKFLSFILTGLPVPPSHKMGFRSSAAKNGLPGEGRHEGLVRRNDVLTNGFIWVSLARSLTRILFVPRLRSPWKTHKALRTWRRLFALFEAIRSWQSLYNFFISELK